MIIFILLTIFLQAQCRCKTLNYFSCMKTWNSYIFALLWQEKWKWSEASKCPACFSRLTVQTRQAAVCSTLSLLHRALSLIVSHEMAIQHWAGTVHECSSTSCLGWSSAAKLSKPCCALQQTQPAGMLQGWSGFQMCRCRCSSRVHWKQAPNPLFTSGVTLILLKGIERSGIGSSEN